MICTVNDACYLKIVLLLHFVSVSTFVAPLTSLTYLFSVLLTHYFLAFQNRILKKAYDIFLAFNPTDKAFVDKICNQFKKSKPDIKLFGIDEHFKEDKVWQDEIFSKMVACKK